MALEVVPQQRLRFLMLTMNSKSALTTYAENKFLIRKAHAGNVIVILIKHFSSSQFSTEEKLINE